MIKVHALSVVPALPRAIAGLHQIAYNLWWSWDHEATELFARIDRELWAAAGANPVKLLGMVRSERLEALAADPGFLEHLERVSHRLAGYLASPTRLEAQEMSPASKPCIAYFSPEFGITQSVPLYAGGLGILAGDHLKSASDLGLPMTGIGLLYREGYFVQYLNPDGWQQELYPANDFSEMPLAPVTAANGRPLLVSLDYPEGAVAAQVWKMQVGKVPLYLLDTDIEQNRPADRQITAQLYGGDPAMRLKQEIMLGIGGMRALAAMGIEPSVCHMNEGHSALQGIERIRILMEKHGVNFAAAREAVAAGSVFTTHTPVPAGNDVFAPELAEEYLAPFRKAVGLSRREFLGLGQQNPTDASEPFAMTVLAFRLARHLNGVSQLHGKVARKMWNSLWPGVPEDEVPIKHVTNAVHLGSWISSDLARLLDRHLGLDWRDEPDDGSVWQKVDQIPDEELWQLRDGCRRQMVALSRQRLRKQLERRGASRTDIAAVDQILEPDALTLGFARRYATYKRGALLLSDPDRLARILNNPERPVQIIFAGKAHPADHDGKEIIQTIVHHCHSDALRRRLVFLEDYDINIARWLLQGVDVWVNTPRRPLEACGTSGMKAALNGAGNVSIPDGWWAEAYSPEIGWNIGAGEDYSDFDYQDDVEAGALYEILENEVVQLFYHRGADGIPRGWVERIKARLKAAGPAFNTNRMLKQYCESFYFPAARVWNSLTENGLRESQTLANWRREISRHWSQVRIVSVETPGKAEVSVGSEMTVRLRAALGRISATDVAAELYFGELDAKSRIVRPTVTRMTFEKTDSEGVCSFVGTLPCQRSGRFGYAVRLLPAHPSLPATHGIGLLLWE